MRKFLLGVVLSIGVGCPLQADQPVVEMDIEPGGGTIPEMTIIRFLRPPYFVLYSDGSVVYLDETNRRVMTGKVSAGRTKDLQETAWRVASENLSLNDGTSLGYDGGVAILTVRRNGEVVRLKARGPCRGECARFLSTLDSFVLKEAVLFRPKRAVLNWFVNPIRLPGVVTWPGDGPLPVEDATIVEGDLLGELISLAGTNYGYITLSDGKDVRVARMVPWLQGEDHQAEVDLYNAGSWGPLLPFGKE